jgi:dienelactone hydrolase
MSRRTVAVLGVLIAGAVVAAVFSRGQDLPTGQLIYNLPVAADETLGYALYLPKDYSAERSWPLLMGFHYEGKGPAVIDTYRDAAEQYGYIVAASNNSRNGVWQESAKVAQAMANDLSERFQVDPARIYVTGLSGGARLAMNIGMTNKAIAGVIASSAGFPDTKPKASLRFPLFATVGDIDFNFIEMRTLDRTLKTPHRLVVFPGGHVLPPPAVATQAIEFMELQAMASGLELRDEAFIHRIWDRRQQAVDAAGETPQGVRLLQAMAEDFKTLRDVSLVQARATELAKRKDVKDAIERERKAELAETELVNEFVTYENGLSNPQTHDESLTMLRSLVSDLRKRAAAVNDTPERARSRRVLEIVTYAPELRVTDRDYMALLLQAPPKR